MAGDSGGDGSFSLTDWHRRRRSGLLSPASPFTESPRRPEASPEPESSPIDLPDHLPDNLSLLGIPLSPFSPVTCPSPAEFIRDDLIRRNIRFVRAEYEFGRCLGEGSFGKVHEATHRRTGARRAVKEIPKSGTETDEFEWELQALVALDHPHIVKVIEYFDDDENYYLVMELCTGPDLFKYIIDSIDNPDGPGWVPEREVSVILRQCLKSVLCCHANGFIHRDLNAKNFMLTGADRTVKLIDFGLAKRFEGFMPKDKFIEIVGTSHYMSPEMLLEGDHSPASDLWSLGVLLYVMLTGTMLLPKDDERKRGLLKKKGYVRRRLENCKVLQKRDVSAPVREILYGMLQHDPLKRISASEALIHPFILGYCHDFLGPPLETPLVFNKEIVAKCRSFAKAPRLKKVALLSMTHLADHERNFLDARHMFRTIDSDGDGEVTFDEFSEGLAAKGIQIPPDLSEVFAACDSDRSGRLTLHEFLACQMPSAVIDERLCHEAFNLLDRDSKGRLSAEDLQAACRSYDLQKCQKMVSQADPTGKGYFDFEDFHRFLRGDDAVNNEPPRKLARTDSGSGPAAFSSFCGSSASEAAGDLGSSSPSNRSALTMALPGPEASVMSSSPQSVNSPQSAYGPVLSPETELGCLSPEAVQEAEQGCTSAENSAEAVQETELGCLSAEAVQEVADEFLF